jgi:hypothetical protein
VTDEEWGAREQELLTSGKVVLIVAKSGANIRVSAMGQAAEPFVYSYPGVDWVEPIDKDIHFACVGYAVEAKWKGGAIGGLAEAIRFVLHNTARVMDHAETLGARFVSVEAPAIDLRAAATAVVSEA